MSQPLENIDKAIISIRAFLREGYTEAFLRGGRFDPNEGWAPMVQACSVILANDQCLNEEQRQNLRQAVDTLQEDSNRLVELLRAYSSNEDRTDAELEGMKLQINVAVDTVRQNFGEASARHYELLGKTSRQKIETDDAEAPKIVKQLNWIKGNWRRSPVVLFLAALIVSATVAWSFRSEIWEKMVEPKPIGEFEIEFTNHTDDTFQLSNRAEVYGCAPYVPGTNTRVASGLLSVLNNNEQIQLGPSESLKVQALLANEPKWLSLAEEADLFLQVLFSASPHPVGQEFVLERSLFENGIRLTIEGPHNLNLCAAR